MPISYDKRIENLRRKRCFQNTLHISTNQSFCYHVEKVKNMYTKNMETEKQFRSLLVQSIDETMYNHEIRQVTTCPKCNQGHVYIQCTVHPDQPVFNRRNYLFYCDHCGEKFDLWFIYRDIYYHEPRTSLEAIPTPFGYIHATCNEKTIPMQVKMDAYTYTPYNEPDKETNIPYMRIEIDVRDFQKGDIITCEFDKDILEFNDSDERSELLTCEDEELMLGFCCFDTEDFLKDSDEYCYSFDSYDAKGVCYNMHAMKDTKKINSSFLYHHITLAVTWIKKAEFSFADDVLFFALSDTTGYL